MFKSFYDAHANALSVTVLAELQATTAPGHFGCRQTLGAMLNSYIGCKMGLIKTIICCNMIFCSCMVIQRVKYYSSHPEPEMETPYLVLNGEYSTWVIPPVLIHKNTQPFALRIILPKTHILNDSILIEYLTIQHNSDILYQFDQTNNLFLSADTIRYQPNRDSLVWEIDTTRSVLKTSYLFYIDKTITDPISVDVSFKDPEHKDSLWQISNELKLVKDNYYGPFYNN